MIALALHNLWGNVAESDLLILVIRTDPEAFMDNTDKAQELVNCLQILEAIGPSLHPSLHEHVGLKINLSKPHFVKV